MKTPGRIRLASMLALGLASAGCGRFPESCFDLSPESRLPGWLTLPRDVRREDVTVQMCYFVGFNGRTATFAMRNARTGAKLADVRGAERGMHPLTANNTEPTRSEYPTYEVIAVGEITEVIEHRRMEPVFYVVDDPAIRHRLGVDR